MTRCTPCDTHRALPAWALLVSRCRRLGRRPPGRLRRLRRRLDRRPPSLPRPRRPGRRRPRPHPAPSTTPTATPAATTTLSLYFLRGEKLGVAERQVPPRPSRRRPRSRPCCAGPSATEKAAGLTSAVPSGTRLLGLSIDGTTARVDLSARVRHRRRQPLDAGARRAGRLHADPVPDDPTPSTSCSTEPLVETLGGEGLILDAGQTRADWRSFEPAIFVERPGVGAVLSSPFVLQGTASVFEGSFAARLVDAGGASIASATCRRRAARPGRGRFRETIPFQTTAPSGTLVVYSQSMEDGSRQNEVRIPVSSVR